MSLLELPQVVQDQPFLQYQPKTLPLGRALEFLGKDALPPDMVGQKLQLLPPAHQILLVKDALFALPGLVGQKLLQLLAQTILG